MTEGMKAFADEFVAFFKANNFRASRDQLHQTFLRDHSKKPLFGTVLQILEEKEIIKCTDGHSRTQFLLLEKGRNYSSWDDLVRSEREASELKKKKENIDLKNAERIFKTYWFTFAMAAIGLVISIILLVLKLRE